MPGKTFEQKYAEARVQAKERLIKNNYFRDDDDNYLGGSKGKTYYVSAEFFNKSIENELNEMIVNYGLTLTDIKNNYKKIANDVLTTLQDDDKFKDGMESGGYTKKGLAIEGTDIALSNEQLLDPKNDATALKLYGVDSDRTFFNKIYNPKKGTFSLNAAYRFLTQKSSIPDIKRALRTLAIVKKVHDSRPLFGRPNDYSMEGDAIEHYTKMIRSFGFTDKDMSTIFNSSDKDLQDKVDHICKVRLENEKTRIDQEDYSKGNVDFISPHNLYEVFSQEGLAVQGATTAKHGIRLLNSYITAKRKYEKAGFFTKYFNKDYRDLKKSINDVEKFLTSNKKENGSPKKQMFTEKELNELLKRDQPLSVHNDIPFLKAHHFKTIENGNIPVENNAPVENNVQNPEPEKQESREKINVSEVALENKQELKESIQQEKSQINEIQKEAVN